MVYTHQLVVASDQFGGRFNSWSLREKKKKEKKLRPANFASKQYVVNNN